MNVLTLYTQAKSMGQYQNKLLCNLKPNYSRLIFNVYSICSQTIDLDMYTRINDLQDKCDSAL